MTTEEMQAHRFWPAVAEFVDLCRERRLLLHVWIGFSACFNRDAVCYSGTLSDCEYAERRLIDWISRKYPEVPWTSKWPAPGNSVKTWGD